MTVQVIDKCRSDKNVGYLTIIDNQQIDMFISYVTGK